MIVDSHVHVLDPATPGAPHEVFPAERVIAEAEAAGIDRIVQITPSYLGWNNTYGIESVRKYPDRIVGVFGRIDPLAPGIDEQLHAFMTEPAMLGVRIQPRLGTPSELWLANCELDGFFAAAPTAEHPRRNLCPDPTRRAARHRSPIPRHSLHHRAHGAGEPRRRRQIRQVG